MVVIITLLLSCTKVTFLSEIVKFYCQQVGGENSTNLREILVVN